MAISLASFPVYLTTILFRVQITNQLPREWAHEALLMQHVR